MNQLNEELNQIDTSEKILTKGVDNQEISESPIITQENIQNSGAGEFNFKNTEEFGTVSTYFNLINALVGAGIVSVPATFKDCGVGIATFLMICCIWLHQFSCEVVFKVQKKLGVSSLDEIAAKLFGLIGSNVISVLIIIYCVSADVAYLIIASNQIKSWLKLAGLNVETHLSWCLIVFIYSVFIPAAITCARNVKFLTKMAVPSVCSVVFYAISIVIKSCIYLNKNGISKSAVGFDFNFGIFTSFGIYFLTFTLSMVMLPIMEPYRNDVYSRIIVVGYALITCGLIVYIPSFFGYLMYGEDSKSDFLSSFSDNDILIIFVRIGMFVSVTASYPAVSLTIFSTLGHIFFKQSIPSQMKTWQRFTIISIVNLVNILLAMFLPDIRPVLGIGGSMGGCIVGYMFPSVCRLVLWEGKIDRWYVFHALYVVFGLFSAGICTYSSISEAVKYFKSK